MSTAGLVLTALLTEGQSVAEIAARYGVHRSWIHRLKARYDTEGETAFEPAPDGRTLHLEPPRPRSPSWS
jgi:transposase